MNYLILNLPFSVLVQLLRNRKFVNYESQGHHA